jgi:DNA-binding NtrC family response regulator
MEESMLALQRKDAAIATESFVFEPVAHPHPHSESEAYPKPEKVVSVLTVSPFEDDHVFLGNIFSHSKWHICGVRCWRDAVEHLTQHRTAVVICERDVPDTDWKQALTQLAELADSPLLIVTSRWADDYLWAEVLNLGGYDVLMKPFDQTEVVRVISLAWLNWKNNHDRARRNDAPMLANAVGM